jgi:hypothetical protein
MPGVHFSMFQKSGRSKPFGPGVLSIDGNFECWNSKKQPSKDADAVLAGKCAGLNIAKTRTKSAESNFCPWVEAEIASDVPELARIPREEEGVSKVRRIWLFLRLVGCKYEGSLIGPCMAWKVARTM